MPVPGLDPDKCRQRNRLAAHRDGINAAPVKLSGSIPANPTGYELTSAKGTLPKSEEAALEQINANLSGDPLKPDDIYIHYLEAGNSNFIGDRFMFLGASTLKNVATMGSQGFAFMNSHRTGGLSHQSELPFGRTFAGRYERFSGPDGTKYERAIVGMYMLRGEQPNGQSGPTTDSLHRGINAGTIFDVSLGLGGGRVVCDVCGEDLYAEDPDTGRYLCPHIPGTDRKMTVEEKASQAARGVTGGVASYSLEDSTPSEVSAVYDGAVPGAGFAKAMSLARSEAVDRKFAKQVGRSYGSLLSRGDRLALGLKPSGGAMPRTISVSRLLSTLGFAPSEIPEDADDVQLQDDRPAQSNDNAAEVTRLRQELAAANVERERLARESQERSETAEREREQARLSRINEQAAKFASDTVAANKAFPSEVEHIERLHKQAAEDDHRSPLAEGSRVANLEASYSARKPHNLTVESITDGALPKDGIILNSEHPNKTLDECKKDNEQWLSKRNAAIQATKTQAN